MYNFAKTRIPLLRFDGNSGAHCYPDFALDVNNGKCKELNRNAPIYYDFKECGDSAKLVWWIWYGWQGPCMLNAGSHDNDWEHITVNFKKNSNSGLWEQDSVTWYQHSGFYTRDVQDTHPNIYIGKIGHGSYDNSCNGLFWSASYCQGGCSFRNDNIQHVSTVTGEVAKRITGEKYFNNADLNKCKGSNFKCPLGTCGCWRNNHVFNAPLCEL